jgi:hypothetical protein
MFSPATMIGVIIVSNQMTIALGISKHIKDGLTIGMPEECPKINWNAVRPQIAAQQ